MSETRGKYHIALGKLYMVIAVTAKKALLSAFSRALDKAFAVSQKTLGKVRGPVKDFAECYTERHSAN